MIKETTARVKELMTEIKLNTKDEVLVNDLCIFYLRAREDQLQSSLEGLKNEN